MFQLMTPWLLEHRVIRVKRCSDGESFVSRGRLDVGSAERCRIEKLAVCNAVQSAPSSHREILQGHTFMETIQEMGKYLFKAMLHGEREFHIALGDFCVRLPSLA